MLRVCRGTGMPGAWRLFFLRLLSCVCFGQPSPLGVRSSLGLEAGASPLPPAIPWWGSRGWLEKFPLDFQIPSHPKKRIPGGLGTFEERWHHRQDDSSRNLPRAVLLGAGTATLRPHAPCPWHAASRLLVPPPASPRIFVRDVPRARLGGLKFPPALGTGEL